MVCFILVLICFCWFFWLEGGGDLIVHRLFNLIIIFFCAGTIKYVDCLEVQVFDLSYLI